MMLRSRVFTFLGALAIASSSYTAFANIPPGTCPEVSSIKSEGLSLAYELMPKVFFAYQISKYNTELSWVFAIGYFKSDTEELAVIDGNKTLVNLAGTPLPEYDKEGYWLCKYDLGTGYTALAIHTETTPGPNQLKRFFHNIY